MSKSPNNLATQKPIFAAIQSVHIPTIERLLLSNNIDLTVQTTTPLCIYGTEVMQNTGLTPFSALCVVYKCYPSKSKEILDMLEKMYDIFSKSNSYTNPLDSQGCTEFMWAVWTGNLDLIKKSHELIKGCNKTYDFNQQDRGGRTALHVAVQNDVEKGIIEYLINDVGVKVDSQNSQGMTALFQAALAQGNDSKFNPKIDLVDELLENGANILCSGKSLLSTLCEHIWKLKQEYLKLIPSKEKKEYMDNITKYTPIVAKLVEKIIQSEKFNPAAKDTGTGFSAVHWVGELGKEAPALLQQLKARGADINNGDAGGRPTLNWYSDYNSPVIVKTLLELKANVNTQAANGETAPHALLLNANKINSTKAKLPTLKLLLSHDNEPPYDPTLKMQGATAQNWLKSIIGKNAETSLLQDLLDCNTLLVEYNVWYDKEVALPLLGEKFADFDLYA